MTKQEQKALARYVMWVKAELELRDWTIVLEWPPGAVDPGDDPTGKHSWGLTVDPVPGRKLATIAVPADFRDDYSPALQRSGIVHELVHCHFAALYDQARRDLLPHLGQQGYDLFIASLVRNLEFGIDAVADALCARLPLIDWDG